MQCVSFGSMYVFIMCLFTFSEYLAEVLFQCQSSPVTVHLTYWFHETLEIFSKISDCFKVLNPTLCFFYKFICWYWPCKGYKKYVFSWYWDLVRVPLSANVVQYFCDIAKAISCVKFYKKNEKLLHFSKLSIWTCCKDLGENFYKMPLRCKTGRRHNVF